MELTFAPVQEVPALSLRPSFDVVVSDEDETRDAPTDHEPNPVRMPKRRLVLGGYHDQAGGD
jgi:hypothetical protein